MEEDTETKKGQEDNRQQKTQEQIQQIQQQLQAVTTSGISTMGQIQQLKHILAQQEKERYQLEGMLRAYTLMAQ